MPRPVPEWVGSSPTQKIPDRVKIRILARQDGRCRGCSREFDLKLKAEFDHIVPLILGGEHRENNLRAMCADCHTEKTKEDKAKKSVVFKGKKAKYGIKKPPANPVPGSKASPWKRRYNRGERRWETVRREDK